jgi:hypothetical protein
MQILFIERFYVILLGWFNLYVFDLNMYVKIFINNIIEYDNKLVG